MLRRAYELHDREYLRMKKEGVRAWDERPWSAPKQSEEGVRKETAQLLTGVLSQPWVPAKGRVLEIGCGTGPLLRWLCKKGYEGHGIDVSPMAIEMAKGFTTEASITFEQGDICSPDLKMPSNYDIVIDGHCLHCVTDRGDRRQFLSNVGVGISGRGVFILLSVCAPFDPTERGDDSSNRIIRDDIMYVVCNTIEEYHGMVAAFSNRYLPIRYVGHWTSILAEVGAAGFECRYCLFQGHNPEDAFGTLCAAFVRTANCERL